MPLTDIAVRNARLKDKPQKLFDANGLYLYVTVKGTKHWRLKYRFEGKEKLLSVGPYPLLSLREAREARDKARKQLLEGKDPASVKAKARALSQAAVENTFEHVAREYVAKLEREGRAATTLKKIRWLLSFALPTLANFDVRHISSAQILALAQAVEIRGRHESARKLRATIGAIFRYAIATARADNDPTIALKGALARPVVKPRAAIIDPVAFGALLRAIWAYDGTHEVVAALKLLALLYPRPGELRQAESSEFDLKKGIWTIPAGRMKMRRPHRVPLNSVAIQVLLQLQRTRFRESPLVFPSLRSASRCLSENTFNAALRRMGYAADQATAHGFRASFSTMANESGLWNPDAIERALAHVEENSARRAYARGEHWDERIKMAAWWAEHCETMRLS